MLNTPPVAYTPKALPIYTTNMILCGEKEEKKKLMYVCFELVLFFHLLFRDKSQASDKFSCIHIPSNLKSFGMHAPAVAFLSGFQLSQAWWYIPISPSSTQEAEQGYKSMASPGYIKTLILISIPILSLPLFAYMFIHMCLWCLGAWRP